MTPPTRHPRDRIRRRAASRALPLVAAALLAAACDRPFEPVVENRNGPFSIAGYLDLGADTQWVRVMPVRQTLLAEPEPIDAVVTLRHEGSGRLVALRDSLFRYSDERLGADVYAHLFWTTERLEPRARYRLIATRSDGAASSAAVEMPDELEFTYLNLRDTAYVEVRAERLLLVETFHALRTPGGIPAGSGARRHFRGTPFGQPRRFPVTVDGAPLTALGLVDARRIELRLVAARPDWPFENPPTNLSAPALPDTTPSNVENGLGFLGGVASRTIPFPRCDVLAPRADGRFSACMVTHDRRAAAVYGRVIRQPCNRPHQLSEVGLRATWTDGGSAVLRWRTGWEGEYRFEGLEPGSTLALQATPTGPFVPLPRLAPGQRYQAPDLFVTTGC